MLEGGSCLFPPMQREKTGVLFPVAEMSMHSRKQWEEQHKKYRQHFLHITHINIICKLCGRGNDSCLRGSLFHLLFTRWHIKWSDRATWPSSNSIWGYTNSLLPSLGPVYGCFRWSFSAEARPLEAEGERVHTASLSLLTIVSGVCTPQQRK